MVLLVLICLFLPYFVTEARQRDFERLSLRHVESRHHWPTVSSLGMLLNHFSILSELRHHGVSATAREYRR